MRFVRRGQLLRELFPRREDYVLSTKVYYPMSDASGDRGLSRRHVLASLDREFGADECRRLEAAYVPHAVAGPE